MKIRISWGEIFRLRDAYAIGNFSSLGLTRISNAGLSSGLYDVSDKKLFFLKVVEHGIKFVIVE